MIQFFILKDRFVENKWAYLPSLKYCFKVSLKLFENLTNSLLFCSSVYQRRAHINLNTCVQINYQIIWIWQDTLNKEFSEPYSHEKKICETNLTVLSHFPLRLIGLQNFIHWVQQFFDCCCNVSGKSQISWLSLIIHRVSFQKNPTYKEPMTETFHLTKLENILT